MRIMGYMVINKHCVELRHCRAQEHENSEFNYIPGTARTEEPEEVKGGG